MIFRFKGNGNERIVDNCPQWRTPCGCLCSYPQSPAGTSGLVPAGVVFKAPLKTLLQRAPAKPSERGEASPHAPTSSPEPAAALRSNPSKGRLHCELTLSLRSVRTLPIGRLHCTSLTVCAGSQGGFSPQFCSANEPPFGNSCKLSLTHGNIAIANYHG